MDIGNKRKGHKKTAPAHCAAFNLRYIAWLLGFGFTLWGNLYLLSEENRISWILLLFCCLFLGCLFWDAVYYVFTKQEIYFVHFWGYKQRLPWLYVASVRKHDFWGAHKELLGYKVFYDQPCKGKAIRKSALLPLTPKVKKCLNTFCTREIHGEEKRKRKK